MAFVDEQEAIKLLKSGTPVALPTETVYGLAGPIKDLDCIQKIFTIKKRPLHDPLIVHVSSQDMALTLIDSPEEDFLRLSEKFWPGPLTLVHTKNSEKVASLITSNEPTVALRCPQSEIFRRIIEKTGPLAAPSANLFKKLSPTTALDAQTGLPDVSVLDGGPCTVGIESTIYHTHKKEILRPGMITGEDIKKVIDYEVGYALSNSGPGSEKDHYQPEKPLWVFESEEELKSHPSYQSFTVIEWSKDEKDMAQNLYSKLRHADKKESSSLAMVFPKNLKIKSEWMGIHNRLFKAAQKWISNGKDIKNETS